MLRKRKPAFRAALVGCVIIISALLLAACEMPGTEPDVVEPAPGEEEMATPVEDGEEVATPEEDGEEMATPEEDGAVTPAIMVEDQAVEEDTVTVAEVTSAGPGWLVIHADEDGSPGPVIGQTFVEEGTATEVTIPIDTAASTGTLHAMLHEDTGEAETYEFPDADPPVSADDGVVVQSFSTEGMGDATPADEEATPTPSEEEATPTPSEEEATPTPSDEEATPTPSEEGAAEEGEANTVEVSLVEFEIDMPAEIPAGTTEFQITNDGEVEHNFEIEGQGIEQVLDSNLQPGDSATMQVDLEPGDYTVYCPVGNHREQGMELQLTVTE